MDTFSSPASHAGPRVTIPRRPLTKAARRDIRRHVALAAELNQHSVMLDGVVWTLHHPQLYKPKQSGMGDAATTSKRRERNAKRLRAAGFPAGDTSSPRFFFPALERWNPTCPAASVAATVIIPAAPTSALA